MIFYQLACSHHYKNLIFAAPSIECLIYIMTPRNDNNITDQQLLIELSKGNHDAFAAIFRRYYADLVIFCCQFISRGDICQDIVQSIFLKLWEMRDVVTIDSSLKSYLIRSAQNMCLNELKHHKVKGQYSSDILSTLPYDIDTSTQDSILYSDLCRLLDVTVEKMPHNERQVWTMSRSMGLKNNEIARALGVSLRTVEQRMSKAKEFVRKAIKHNWTTIVLLFIFFHGK